ncbi:MAG: BTAD domain-containing putative transcriptional regulator [Anaerolineae bacterium]|jgi:DNA-binding SARP family transcriptional activator|nr:BTAD domain-containing putative transcriptional regulator [Anaerolineae bacterium]
MAAHLALALMGPFEATLNGQATENLGSDRLRALLAYLAVEREREHSREGLASLLWPERPDREALSALRYALSNLRHALGDLPAHSPFLLVTRRTLQFNTASDHWLDVAEFQGLVGRPDVPGLERAATLYRGLFLEGLSVADSPAFDEWMLLKGEELRRGAMSALWRLTALQLQRGETGEAARWARRQLELEPYHEQAHRQLMAALALGGERSAALAHYAACSRLLERELGCGPEDETQALADQIRNGALPRPPLPPGVLDAPRAEGPAPRSVGLRPRSRTRFVAREGELARLGALLDGALADQGGVGLIAGEAGSGKTALLDEFAHRAAAAHGDLIVLRGKCNAHAGAGDPHLPFREMLQTLAGDVEGKRAGGTLSPEQARRAWEALPAVGAALVEHGPDLIDRFVPGEPLLRRAEAFPAPGPTAGSGRRGGQAWQARLWEALRRAGEGTPPGSGGASPAASNLSSSIRGSGERGRWALQPDLFGQVTQVLHVVSMDRPLLLAVDDLQWADGGTAALLFHLGRRLAGSRILLLGAYRPEAVAHAEGAQAVPGVGEILRELVREWGEVVVDLDGADGRAFVEAYVDGAPNRLGAAFRQALYDHTGGNPLFTVELLNSFERDGTVVQDGAGRWIAAGVPDWERWPPQVEAVIAGHLAALPDEDRTLLRAASVQGEQFTAEAAARALGWSEEATARRLSGPLRIRHRLVEAVSLERLAWNGQRLSRYRFRHALVQRSVYRSLDPVEGSGLHEATARAMESLYASPAGQAAGAGLPGAGEVPPGAAAQALAPELARHYEAAAMPLEAARWRLAAGQWAIRLVAYDEAVAHLERGLALLEDLSPSPEGLRLELGLHLALIMPVSLRSGWQTPAATRALERLSVLVQHPDLRDEPQRRDALSVLALATGWSADPERGRRVGEQLLRMGEAGDARACLQAHWVLGHSEWLKGRLVAARERLEVALALSRPQAGDAQGHLFLVAPGVTARAVLGFVLWLLGYPDQARDCLQRAVAQAEVLEQPSSTAFAHLMAGMVHWFLGRDSSAALAHAQVLRSLEGTGLFYGAWAELLVHGRGGAGQPGRHGSQARMAEAGAALQAAGAGVGHVGQLMLRAQALVRAGRPAAAAEIMDEALAWIERTGVRLMEAEAWRMRGQFLRAQAADAPASLSAAEACLRRALELAREQQARWLELRAAADLARLWQAQGRRGEARELLAPIYAWFVEGFDTADLVDAGTLLAQLK